MGYKSEADLAELLPQVTTDDVLEFGMIPEFVGRLPVVSTLQPLDEASLIRCLTEPKSALVRQYQTLFEMENCELSFTAESLVAIARRAMERGTGARGLRSIVEEVMLDVMFELPDQPEGSAFAVTEDVVEGRDKFFKLPEAKTKSA